MFVCFSWLENLHVARFGIAHGCRVGPMISIRPQLMDNELFLKVVYFTTLASASLLAGFSLTINKNKLDPSSSSEAKLHNEGVALAKKALMRGSLYAMTGMGIIALASYGIFGLPKKNPQKEPIVDNLVDPVNF